MYSPVRRNVLRTTQTTQVGDYTCNNETPIKFIKHLITKSRKGPRFSHLVFSVVHGRRT